MKIIEIEALENGGHRNQTSDFITIPKGWAFVPHNIETPNFPFGNIEVEEIDGVMTVTKWTPGVIPKIEPIPEPIKTVTAEDILNALTGGGN